MTKRAQQVALSHGFFVFLHPLLQGGSVSGGSDGSGSSCLSESLTTSYTSASLALAIHGSRLIQPLHRSHLPIWRA